MRGVTDAAVLGTLALAGLGLAGLQVAWACAPGVLLWTAREVCAQVKGGRRGR